MKIGILFFVLVGCSSLSFNPLTQNIPDASRKICLSSFGKGRLSAQNQKFVFKYEAALEKKFHNWKLALTFPMRATELFQVDWSENKVKLITGLEEKLLTENKNIDPRSLEIFTSKLGQLIQEISYLQNENDKKDELKFNWNISKNVLSAEDEKKEFQAVFKNRESNGHFGHMSVSYLDSESELGYKMELILSKCLESKPY